MSLTDEELAAIRKVNGRIGLEVIDSRGKSFWITDITGDDRIRVVDDQERAYWWNEQSKCATFIPKPKPTGREWSRKQR